MLATLGAAISRLEHAIDNLSNNAVNMEASRSRIMDANYAKESTELARTQIIQQAFINWYSNARTSESKITISIELISKDGA